MIRVIVIVSLCRINTHGHTNGHGHSHSHYNNSYSHQNAIPLPAPRSRPTNPNKVRHKARHKLDPRTTQQVNTSKDNYLISNTCLSMETEARLGFASVDA